MFEITSALGRVLDALSVRQSVLSDNIANVNTPGFKRSDVDFREVARQAFAELEKTSPHRGQRASQGPIRVVQDRTSTMRNDGNNVDIEREMVLLEETALRYNTIAEYVSRRLRDLRTVIDAGRR
ncbi:MAG: flagellar basal body rod protein FlgB [Firmicutes bacterium]|nr:flagellar basal body rod protein FlgB [Bacillota bacterium]